MIGSFFHSPKHRRFSMPFRYYNPEKEEMQDREDRIKKELGIHEKKGTDSDYRPNIRGQFRRAMNHSSKTASGERRRSNTRLLLLIVIISLAAYLLFKF
ncbi:hypothetical protein [Sunxiuqinia sp. sy24]|uniref:hypothetical protein n=1 Tax=Sunxiuqinia sp. sy24 TaxID=3461495 RepID=UPI0040459496